MLCKHVVHKMVQALSGQMCIKKGLKDNTMPEKASNKSGTLSSARRHYIVEHEPKRCAPCKNTHRGTDHNGFAAGACFNSDADSLFFPIQNQAGEDVETRNKGKHRLDISVCKHDLWSVLYLKSVFSIDWS